MRRRRDLGRKIERQIVTLKRREGVAPLGANAEALEQQLARTGPIGSVIARVLVCLGTIGRADLTRSERCANDLAKS